MRVIKLISSIALISALISCNSDDDSEPQVDLSNVSTAVVLDYAKFYSDYSWYNASYYSSEEFFSHLGRNHVIHGKGFGSTDEVKVYLVNEQKTDSIEIPATVVADSLSFTIPNDYLGSGPDERLKKAYVGIKTKSAYQYIINDSTRTILQKKPFHKAEQPNLKLRIFNTQPYINKVTLSPTSVPSACANGTDLTFEGDFLGLKERFYWTPESSKLVILNSNDEVYGEYPSGLSQMSCNGFLLSWDPDTFEYGGLLAYHRNNMGSIQLSNLPVGNYSAKIVFQFEDGETRETNTIGFTKE
ncbi:hypothetical protein [Spongiimicrobium sp. 3-5]|uniref:hypothetical protein n=1 Tax=Spongiimicrobium sp. 3-5 TaxID=3332596 RepID=UPI003980A0BF